ncbi:hypothetical protein GQR58_030039 [Nymphon striatum]|nr:hypothetical protein GQR58_030039 [Nymphon striatum]
MKGNALARFIARSRRPRTGSWPGLSGGVASLKGIAFINWTIGTNGWELTERPVDSGLVTSSPQREPHTGSAAPGHDHDANDAPVLDRRAVLLAVGAAAALAACSAGEEELLGLPQPTFPPSAGGSGLDSELMHATLLRGVFSERQLYEVMVDFWNNHFTVYLINQGRYRHMVNQSDRTVARANALGYFSNMLMASAKDPAMLTFLDNATSDANSAAGINENYGREILELHSLGIVNGQQVYTEEDMRQVSLVLSGWSVDWQQDRDAFKFRPLWHHRGPVSILGGAWSRPDRTGASDAQLLADGENLVSFLAHHPSTARHLAFKMCRRFVADEPPMGLVDRMASIYLANGTAIAPMLRELFTSPEFAENTDTKLRRGFEVVMGISAGTQRKYRHQPGWRHRDRAAFAQVVAGGSGTAWATAVLEGLTRRLLRHWH